MVSTADLYDAHGDRLRVLDPALRSYGGAPSCCGPAATVKVFEDNALVRQALEQPGEGRVLVVDGGASLRYALVGDQIAELAVRNRWAGIVVHGAIRDSAAIATLPVAVFALGTNPRKTDKRGEGRSGAALEINGVTIAPGQWIAADSDGVVVAAAGLALLDGNPQVPHLGRFT